MRFIDTHCHYSDEAYGAEAPEAIRRSIEAGVGKMLQADIDSRERPAMYGLCERYPGVLFPMLGLYPGSVDAGWRDEIDALEPWFAKNPVAVGEIGLDYHFSTEFKEEQKEALRVQLELASERDLPVNIHLRDATEDFIKIIRDSSRLHLHGNLHAYSGSAETFRELSRYADWSVGIGGVVTFKKASIAETLREIPLEKILLETDAPYLAPTPFRGTRNESAYIPVIAAKVAEIKGITLEKLADLTTENAEKLFPRIAE